MQRTRADQPHEELEKPHLEGEYGRLEYRIICNSEHFLVVNPVKRVKKKQKTAEPRKRGRLLQQR